MKVSANHISNNRILKEIQKSHYNFSVIAVAKYFLSHWRDPQIQAVDISSTLNLSKPQIYRIIKTLKPLGFIQTSFDNMGHPFYKVSRLSFREVQQALSSTTNTTSVVSIGKVKQVGKLKQLSTRKIQKTFDKKYDRNIKSASVPPPVWLVDLYETKSRSAELNDLEYQCLFSAWNRLFHRPLVLVVVSTLVGAAPSARKYNKTKDPAWIDEQRKFTAKTKKRQKDNNAFRKYNKLNSFP